ncbi:hypothetical protein O181_020965 [Austropuccinia psidii MF-1]|uniref:Leucine-rich repeat-containing protein n=1 Tax=Austropuccinia psidii MF-1 TaxID=1389203 RepID=A0A9Q3CDN4_9BASI|nr:hypothetical protein [Austropuccinia psidii MF-1]
MLPSTSSTHLPDDYIHQLSNQIRKHQSSLDAITNSNKKLNRHLPSPSYISNWSSFINLSNAFNPIYHLNSNHEIIFEIDPHHLYYLLLKFDQIGLQSVSLDIQLKDIDHCKIGLKNYDPTNWMIGFNPAYHSLKLDKSDTSSLLSNLSSSLSLNSNWLNSFNQNLIKLPFKANSFELSLEDQVKYLYSIFTKLPSLRLKPSSNPIITPYSTSNSNHQTTIEPMQLLEGFTDLPNQNALPLTCFKNLWCLYIQDLDPRLFIGWYNLSITLRRLEIRRSGLEDFQTLLIDAILGDINRDTKKHSNQNQNLLEPHQSSTNHPSNQSQFNLPFQNSSHQISSNHPFNNLPTLAWSFLQHLCLADNSLTFFPSTPLIALTSLTSLDLSSNLLIAVPSGLDVLTRLKFLNLADNMIDSVLGIYQTLKNISTINLSRNRLSSLCGLERLNSLQRLDIHLNQIHDISELSRLATLPSLTALWVSQNPFCLTHTDWRIQTFNYFAAENREIDRQSDMIELELENSKPTYSERKFIRKPHSSLFHIETSIKTPQLLKKTVIRSPDRMHRTRQKDMESVRLHSEDNKAPTDLDHSPAQSSLAFETSYSNSKMKEVLKKKEKSCRKKHARIVHLESQSTNLSPLISSSSAQPATCNSINETSITHAHNPTRLAPENIPNPLKESDSIGVNNVICADGEISTFDSSKNPPLIGVHREETHSLNQVESEADLPADKGFNSIGNEFRRKIEALRDEVGEGWLRVLGESEFGNNQDQ